MGSEMCIRDSHFAIPQQLESSSGSLVLGVRPEHISLTDQSTADGASLRAQVIAVEYLGTTQIVVLQSDYGEIKARVDSSLSVSAGDQTGLTFNAETITLFNGDSGRAIRSNLNELAIPQTDSSRVYETRAAEKGASNHG